jgi:hypothetical protein
LTSVTPPNGQQKTSPMMNMWVLPAVLSFDSWPQNCWVIKSQK